jgi:hypothetical protein
MKYLCVIAALALTSCASSYTFTPDPGPITNGVGDHVANLIGFCEGDYMSCAKAQCKHGFNVVKVPHDDVHGAVDGVIVCTSVGPLVPYVPKVVVIQQ